jgi:hypothetical protein
MGLSNYRVPGWWSSGPGLERQTILTSNTPRVDQTSQFLSLLCKQTRRVRSQDLSLLALLRPPEYFSQLTSALWAFLGIPCRSGYGLTEYTRYEIRRGALSSQRCSLHETFCSGTKDKTIPRRSELEILPLRRLRPCPESGKLVDLDCGELSGLFGPQSILCLNLYSVLSVVSFLR